MKRKPKAKQRKRSNCTADQFVEAWTAANSVEEVMEKVNLSKYTVYSRVSSYRKRGVHLKRMNRKRAKLDVERLNAIITSVEANKKRK